jgi:hypothetical protein
MKHVSSDQQLALEVAKHYADPLGFVLMAFPWGEKGTPLEHEEGPDENQRQFLIALGAQVKARGFRGRSPVMPILMALSSGHGTCKSTLGAWIAVWILSTRPHSIGTVTATTFKQLESRTWAAIRQWTKLSIAAHWFDIQKKRHLLEAEPRRLEGRYPDLPRRQRPVLRRPACQELDLLVPVRRSVEHPERHLGRGLGRPHRCRAHILRLGTTHAVQWQIPRDLFRLRAKSLEPRHHRQP